jgi:hypothetical protein
MEATSMRVMKVKARRLRLMKLRPLRWQDLVEAWMVKLKGMKALALL